MKKLLSVVGVVAVAAATLIVWGGGVAALDTADSELTQEITSGNLTTSIRTSGGAVVGAPSFAMNSTAVSTSAQTITGTFGDTDQRITVDNPGAASGGWTLALNVDDPGNSVWVDGAKTYAYNGNSTTGQLTVNPAAGSLQAPTGGTTGVTLGSQTAFSGSSAITLITASGASADIWNGYVTGIGLSQAIPASQPAGDYTLDLVQTVTAP